MIFNFTAVNGGGSATLYTITLIDGFGYVDKNEAEEGETVTVTMPEISPGKQGYTATVRNANTQAEIYKQIRLDASSTWQFTMPAASVTVNITS